MNLPASPSRPQPAPQHRRRTPNDDDWHRGFVRYLLLGAMVLGLATLAPYIFATGNTFSIAVFVALYALAALIAVLPGPVRLRLAAFLVVAFALAAGHLRYATIGPEVMLYFLAVIVFAGMLWSPLAGLFATGLTVIAVVMTESTRNLTIAQAGTAYGPFRAAAIAIGALLFGVAVTLAAKQSRRASVGAEQQVAEAQRNLQEERDSLQQSLAAGAAQLRAVIDVSQVATAILDPEQLIQRVVNLITDRFGFYYAAIFILNERGDEAELRSATGEAGRLLRERRHHLPVGGRSMVGRAISTRQARIALEAGAEPARFDNPLLPYTRSEIALPLLVGDRVLGALDVQSTKPAAFAASDIETLQGMANQVAIAYENARLFDASRRSLDEMGQVQRQNVRRAWSPEAVPGPLEYMVGDEQVPAGSPALQIDLSLRDQIIGQISLASETDWTPEQRNLVEAVATQAALALENARLLEASQSAAQREHVLADITAKVWAAESLDGILRTAVSELGHALEADEAFIELSLDKSNE